VGRCGYSISVKLAVKAERNINLSYRLVAAPVHIIIHHHLFLATEKNVKNIYNVPKTYNHVFDDKLYKNCPFKNWHTTKTVGHRQVFYFPTLPI